MPELLSLDAIREAATRIAHVARRTPLVELTALDALGTADSARLFLKCENLQATGAFKLRGAYNMVAKLPDEARRAGVITFSSGNHGLAISFAAKLAGVPAVIVMPTTAPPNKVEGARQLGAEVVFEGTTTLQRKARAEQIAAERHLTIVPPYDHEWIMAGQGTIGLEILEQCPGVGTVYVPVSGGGLIGGIATAIKRSNPAVQVVAVEPAGAPKVSASVKAGRQVTLEKISGIADGLLAVRPGDLTFPHILAFVDRVVTVDDLAIVEAMRIVFRDAKVVAEPSGAITVAAALADLAHGPVGLPIGGKPVVRASGPAVAVVSGGNVDAARFARYLTEGV